MSDEKFFADENQRLHEANVALAEANVNLLSLLEKEKSKMPVRGKNLAGLFLSGCFLVGGQFLPGDIVDILGVKFHSNVLQIIGGFVLVVLLAGPFLLQLVNAIRGQKLSTQNGGQNDTVV